MMKHFSADIAPAREEHRAHPVPTAQAGLPTLLGACFADLKQTADDTDAAANAPLIRAMTELALIERGALRPGSRRGQKALRVARLSMAHRLIARHLAEPALSPAMVANLLGISLRHLHVLFEAAEMSFSETVTAMRIRESCRLLREAPERAIADIAQDCGFESLATFYRAFKAAEATTPRDYRARGSLRDGQHPDRFTMHSTMTPPMAAPDAEQSHTLGNTTLQSSKSIACAD